MVTDTELMSRFYNENGASLDKQDRFLKNYILNEGWKDKG
jgi:hypothetical protein